MPRRRVIELPHAQHSAPIPTAVLIDNVLVSSAVFGALPETGAVPERVEDEIAAIFDNIELILELAGATLDDVAQMSVLVRSDSYRPHINEHWTRLFPDPDDRPARHITLVENLRARAQVEFLAVLPRSSV